MVFKKMIFGIFFVVITAQAQPSSSMGTNGLVPGTSAADAQAPASAPAAPPLTEREIFLDVGRAGVRRHRMSVVPFAFQAEAAVPKSNVTEGQFDKKISEDYPARFKDILDFTKGFEFVEDKVLAEKNRIQNEPLFDEWQALKSESVVMGKFQKNQNDLYTIELKLYAVPKKRLLLGKRYLKVKTKDIDGVLRRFADLVIESMTGELGIFSSKLAFVGTPVLGRGRQIYIAQFDGSHLQQITDDGAIHMSPAWSADGTKLAYTSFKSGKAEIYIYSLLTKKHTRLTYSPSGNNSGANWHPDGKLMAYAAGFAGVTSIYSINALTGGQKTSLVSGSGLEVEPAFSPDKKSLAFASGRFGNPHIFVRDLESNKDTRITFAGWYNSSPSWRPDSRKLAFAGYDKEIDRYDIFIVNPDGRQLERLTLNQGDNERPQWSPDGRFLAFQSNRGSGPRGKSRGYKIFVMNRDGGDQRSLSIPLADAVMPAWSPRMHDNDD